MASFIHSKTFAKKQAQRNKNHVGPLLGASLVFLIVISCGTFPSSAQTTPTVAATPVPSETSVPSPTITPTSTSAPPTLLTSAAVPCFRGPGGAYELVASLDAGEEAEIVGQSEGFWIVRTSNEAVCWVPDQGVIPQGDFAGLPEVEPPPIPTPAAPVAPTNLEAFNNACYTDKSYTPNKRINRFHLYWQDMSNNEDGFHVYRDGNLVAELPPDQTEVIDEIVSQNDRPHIYYVVAYNEAGEAKSDVISVTCQGVGENGGGYSP